MAGGHGGHGDDHGKKGGHAKKGGHGKDHGGGGHGGGGHGGGGGGSASGGVIALVIIVTIVFGFLQLYRTGQLGSMFTPTNASSFQASGKSAEQINAELTPIRVLVTPEGSAPITVNRGYEVEIRFINSRLQEVEFLFARGDKKEFHKKGSEWSTIISGPNTFQIKGNPFSENVHLIVRKQNPGSQ